MSSRISLHMCDTIGAAALLMRSLRDSAKVLIPKAEELISPLFDKPEVKAEPLAILPHLAILRLKTLTVGEVEILRRSLADFTVKKGVNKSKSLVISYLASYCLSLSTETRKEDSDVYIAHVAGRILTTLGFQLKFVLMHEKLLSSLQERLDLSSHSPKWDEERYDVSVLAKSLSSLAAITHIINIVNEEEASEEALTSPQIAKSLEILAAGATTSLLLADIHKALCWMQRIALLKAKQRHFLHELYQILAQFHEWMRDSPHNITAKELFSYPPVYEEKIAFCARPEDFGVCKAFFAAYKIDEEKSCYDAVYTFLQSLKDGYPRSLRRLILPACHLSWPGKASVPFTPWDKMYETYTAVEKSEETISIVVKTAPKKEKRRPAIICPAVTEEKEEKERLDLFKVPDAAPLSYATRVLIWFDDPESALTREEYVDKSPDYKKEALAHHTFPFAVDALREMAGYSEKITYTSPSGQTSIQTRLVGQLGESCGIFEISVNRSGIVIHRYFRPFKSLADIFALGVSNSEPFFPKLGEEPGHLCTYKEIYKRDHQGTVSIHDETTGAVLARIFKRY